MGNYKLGRNEGLITSWTKITTQSMSIGVFGSWYLVGMVAID